MLTDSPAAPVADLLEFPGAAGAPDVGQVDAVSPGARVHGSLFASTMVIGLFACFAVDQLRALLGYSRFVTDEDQTLLWSAGRELLHLHLHEPNFYGQNYNTVFEAVPGELFHLLGVSLSLASPLGAMLMASACWLVLAWAAHRHGHRLAAAAALALPVCMSVPYLLLFDAPRGVLSGDLAGAVAIAAALAIPRPRRRLAVLIAVGGLAIVWENAVALAVLPALAATTLGGMRGLLDRPRRTLLVAGGALLVPVGSWMLDHVWYRSHPAFVTAGAVDTKLQLSVLGTNLSHPNRLLAFYEPELWQHPAVAVLAIAVLLILAIALSITFRRPEAAAAALTFLAVLLLILSVRDTLDVHRDLYLSGSRFLLPMPIGLWVVLHFSLSSARHGQRGHAVGHRRLDQRVPMAAIIVIAAASMIVAGSRFSAETRAETAVDSGAHAAIAVVNPAALLAECAAATRIYRDTRAQLLVTNERNVAYGCAAQSGLNTLDADFDRRGWLLRTAAIRPVSRILIQDRTCPSLVPESGACRALGDRIVLLLTPPRPPSVSLARAGIPIRGATRGP
jgi:hypothetical protein